MDRARRGLLGADHHAAGRSQRQQRDRRSADDVVEITVGSDAIGAVAVEIEADAVEGHTRRGDHAVGRHADRIGNRLVVRRQIDVGLQPRDIDLAVVHVPSLRLPRHGIAQLGEPGERHVVWHEARPVGDASSRLVDEQRLGRAREQQ